MEPLQAYLNQHGHPVALYSDRYSICRVNHLGREGESTQLPRARPSLGMASDRSRLKNMVHDQEA